MEFRAETVYSHTASANTGILEARLWLGDRDRALLAIASFIIHYLDRQAGNNFGSFAQDSDYPLTGLLPRNAATGISRP
jgi:hypothetical protein